MGMAYLVLPVVLGPRFTWDYRSFSSGSLTWLENRWHCQSAVSSGCSRGLRPLQVAFLWVALDSSNCGGVIHDRASPESEVEDVLPLQCSLGSDVASLPQKSPARPDSRGGHVDPTAPWQECLVTLQAEPVEGSYFRAISLKPQWPLVCASHKPGSCLPQGLYTEGCFHG